MDTQRKILVFARGGTTEGEFRDEVVAPLTGKAIKDLNSRGGNLLHEKTPFSKAFVRHSGYVATKQTGKALVTGLLNLRSSAGKIYPTSVETLETYGFEGVDIAEDKRLSLEGVTFLPDTADARDKFFVIGSAVYMRSWMENPDVDFFIGGSRTPYREVVARGREILKDCVDKLVNGDYDAGVIVSHQGIIEAPLFAATGKKRLKDIRGLFEEGDTSHLYLDVARDRSYTAQLFLKNSLRPKAVDLSTLLAE